MINLASRIHPLSIYTTSHANVWVKREDELGFAVSGTKKRKYISLLPYIINCGFEQVALIGGENSNNVQALLQLLNEAKVATILYLKKQKNPSPKGNSFLLSLLSEPQNIRYVSSDEWENVIDIATKEMQEKQLNSFLVVPEGGSCVQSIEGLATLLEDIKRNEADNKLLFDHIFVDAGTSISAAVLGFCSEMQGRASQLHVVHIAGNPALFEKQWQECEAYFQQQLGMKNVHHYFPATAKSFGAVNATIWQEIKILAQKEGILTDPIYTAKLFYTAKYIIQNQSLTGNILIIHSGGGTGLMGFAP